MADKQDFKQPSVKEQYWRDMVQQWQRSKFQMWDDVSLLNA